MYECGYRPKDLYSLLMRDIYYIFLGKKNRHTQEQHLFRNVAVIIADVFSQVMGGQSIHNDLKKMWPVEGDEGGREMTRDEVRGLLRKHRQMLAKKKANE